MLLIAYQEVDSLNKAELIEAVAKAAGTEKRTTEGVLDAFFKTVVSEVKKNGKVAWPKFGSFSLSRRAARMGRNPQTGEQVKIAASNTMRFSASTTLKESLGKKKAK